MFCAARINFSESEVLDREVSFLSEVFSFLRSNYSFLRPDRCQNLATLDFGSPDQETRIIWSKKFRFFSKKWRADSFYGPEQVHFSSADIFFVLRILDDLKVQSWDLVPWFLLPWRRHSQAMYTQKVSLKIADHRPAIFQ